MESFIVRMLEMRQPNSLERSPQLAVSSNPRNSHRSYDLSNLSQIQDELERTPAGWQQKALGFHMIVRMLGSNRGLDSHSIEAY